MRLFKRKENRIAVVKVEGIIADGDSFAASRSKVQAALKEARKRKARAVVLRVNSPGGSVAACQEIFASIVRLKEEGLPVVASMGDMAASGGVYVSMAADEVIANAGTVTGSIGVIIKSSNLSHLYDKVGVSPKVVKSGPHKDMLATYRSFSRDEEALLQDVIMDTHKQFVDAVATSRKKSTGEIERIADGRILTGRQALNVGLLDALGDLDFAVKRAAARAGIEGKPRVITIEPRKGMWQRLFSPFTGLGQQVAVGANLTGIPLWLLPTF
jgi:protease-4